MMRIGNHIYNTDSHTYVMGILNVTPDSFSDGGKYKQMDAAISHAVRMADEGADIIDIGGESTRPGYTKISDEEEIERVAPVIEAVKKEIDIPISLDTYKSKVARAGILAGALLINDIWGFKYDNEMAMVVADSDASVCLMHNKKEAVYSDFIKDVIADIKESIDIAINSGINKDRIMIDPGVGFAKNTEENLLVLNELEKFKELDYPVLLGCSRKSVIGNTLNLKVNERLEGTLVTTTIAVMKGIPFVRVHDVKENVRAIKMTEAILNAR